MSGEAFTTLYNDQENCKLRLYANRPELQSFSEVNTEVKLFNEKKGLLFGCTLAAVLACSISPGNGLKVGALSLELLVNVSGVG